MERYRYYPHHWRITRSSSVTDETWFWICMMHGYKCEQHMSIFMRIPKHRDRQERLF